MAWKDSEDGTPFGRYRLLELLGRGGMGDVWRAYDTVIDRVVALKVLSPNFADDKDFQQRFRREAKAAAGLNAPHIVPIHDFGEIDGRLYVTMQLIKGCDLEHLLNNGPLSPARTVKVIEQISLALQAAHDIGLVHRDVKPSNILLTKDDFAYLIDFGIAQAVGESKLTKTGVVIGTMAYMAPERLTIGAVDARTDIYSLTCVLYECLTGSQPYPGGGNEQQITAHLTFDPPRPSRQNPSVPAAFDEVVARGMAKQPASRFPNAGSLATSASAAAASSRDQNTREPGGTRRFSTRWTHPDTTGDTHYPNDHRIREPLKAKSGSGRRVPIAAAIVALLAAASIAAWVASPANWGPPAVSEATATSAPTAGDTSGLSPTVQPSPTSRQLRPSIPGTDGQGFVGYPGARCDPGNTPAVMARTDKSLVVVCQIGPANYYYRALRLGDGASIELANAVRSSDGFDVLNPADGSLRQVRPTFVRITFPSDPAQSEPVIDYASR